MKLALMSLGCSKNLIDSELFLGVATKYNLELVNNIEEADIVVVNTCGFIESAKQEAIDNILNLVQKSNKKYKVVAMGCLVERYLEDLEREIPEVDFYFPIRDYDNIDELFKKLTLSNESHKMEYTNRVITTPTSTAYLRIAEGCDNKCSYCAIPLIRGSFKSRSFDSLIEEAKYLAKQGVKEITLIAQDTTRYGTDFKDDPRRLHDLLHEISKIESVKWVRVLYLYPDEITEELLNEFKNNDKVVKYFDIPIQHASNRMLKLMNRRGSCELIRKHILQFKEAIPGLVIRTTVITGFPQEEEKDHLELVNFIKEIKFDRLGAFKYSEEEDTKSFDMNPKVDEQTMNRRYHEIMVAQMAVSEDLNQHLIGKTFECLVERYDYDRLAYVGRNYMYAPDDVDGNVYIYSNVPLNAGDFVSVKIVDAYEYDLEGVYVENE